MYICVCMYMDIIIVVIRIVFIISIYMYICILWAMVLLGLGEVVLSSERHGTSGFREYGFQQKGTWLSCTYRIHVSSLLLLLL